VSEGRSENLFFLKSQEEKVKKLIGILLAAAAAINISFSTCAAEGLPAGGKVIAYYFHGTMRCPTCHKLEQYSKEAVETYFKDELASSALEFKAINVENRGNEHYGNDYQLYTKSLVLSLIKYGKEVKWKNMDKIWEYVRDKQKFFDYVKSGVSDYLKEAQ